MTEQDQNTIEMLLNLAENIRRGNVNVVDLQGSFKADSTAKLELALYGNPVVAIFSEGCPSGNLDESYIDSVYVKWLQSPDGLRCMDFDSLRSEYLGNRLRTAFEAGARIGRIRE